MKTVRLTDEAYDLIMALIEERLVDLGPDDPEYVAVDAAASEMDTAQD